MVSGLGVTKCCRPIKESCVSVTRFVEQFFVTKHVHSLYIFYTFLMFHCRLIWNKRWNIESSRSRDQTKAPPHAGSVWSTVTVGRRWRIKMRSLTPGQSHVDRERLVDIKHWWNCRLAWSYIHVVKRATFPQTYSTCRRVCVWLMIGWVRQRAAYVRLHTICD